MDVDDALSQQIRAHVDDNMNLAVTLYLVLLMFKDLAPTTAQSVTRPHVWL